MRVLFLHTNDSRYVAFRSSIAALAGALRGSPHELMVESLDPDWTIERAAAQITERSPDVVAASCMTRDWPVHEVLLPLVAEQSEPFVVVGGYHATFAAQEVAQSPGVDAIGIGECERSFPSLLERIELGSTLATFPGMWVRGSTGFTDPRPPADPEPDIAALPRWDYDVFGGLVRIAQPRETDLMRVRASRGCPFDCTYCSNPAWVEVNRMRSGASRNVRPVDHLCDELAELRDRYRPSGFDFWDEHFPVAIEWLERFADEYPRRVGIPFHCEMHPNASSNERLEALARAGCKLMNFGVESGNYDLRRRVLLRRTPADTYFRVVEKAKSLGIEVQTSVMFAMPGETFAMGLETIDLLRALKPNFAAASVYTALPGTALGGKRRPRAGLNPSDRIGDSMDRFEPQVQLDRMTDAEARELLRLADELQDELRQQTDLEASHRRRQRGDSVARLNNLLDIDGSARWSIAAVEHSGALLLLELGGELEGNVVCFERRRDSTKSFMLASDIAISYRGQLLSRPLEAALEEIQRRAETLSFGELEAAARS